MAKKKGQKVQSEINIGMVGHVDHGKTSLVQALSGVWTDTHSEELRRGISIKLGYADFDVYKCVDCDPPVYTTERKCPACGSKAEFVRKISFVDAPGHEILMARMLSGAAIMDGAVLVIAANEKCPQPQTREHLAALQITGIKNIIVVQNKVELVSDEDAKKNYEQIRDFVTQTMNIDEVPIIPISALHKANIDVVTAALQEFIPTPPRELDKPAKLYIARSFDINRPGATIDELKGGVIGGSIKEGIFKIADEIEIAPGIRREKGGPYERVHSVITTLQAGGNVKLEEAKPGGLIALGTKLDPSITKGDGLVGNVVGLPDTLPPVWATLQVQVTLLERVVGLAKEKKVEPIKLNEKLMLTAGTATTVGTVKKTGKNAELALQRPVCIEPGSRIAISRRISGRWRLIGYGIVS